MALTVEHVSCYHGVRVRSPHGWECIHCGHVRSHLAHSEAVTQVDVSESITGDSSERDSPVSVAGAWAVGAVASDDRRTPEWLLAYLQQYYVIGWDLAAHAGNSVCGDRFFGPGSIYGEDALRIDWAGVILAAVGGVWPAGFAAFLNPPFSRDEGGILRWVYAAEGAAANGLRSLLLLPADASTDYFRHATHHPHWFTKRPVYGNAPKDAKGRPTPAKFGSMLVEVRPPHPRVYAA